MFVLCLDFFSTNLLRTVGIRTIFGLFRTKKINSCSMRSPSSILYDLGRFLGKFGSGSFLVLCCLFGVCVAVTRIATASFLALPSHDLHIEFLWIYSSIVTERNPITPNIKGLNIIVWKLSGLFIDRRAFQRHLPWWEPTIANQRPMVRW